MHCHCGTNNIAPRWTFKDPCKPEVRPGVREESASPAWLVEPAMNARDITKGIYGGLTLDVDRHYIGSVTATTHQGPHAVRVSQDTNPDCPIHSPARKPLSQRGGRNLFKNDNYRRRPSSDNLQNASRIQIYHKKYKFLCSTVIVRVTIRFVYIISCKTCG